jgi:serine/threonine protein kinase
MPPVDSLEAGRTVDRYEVVARISAGGMGGVYRARDPLLERELVLQVLPLRLPFNAEGPERVIREAHTAWALDHPIIVTISAIW